MRRITKIPKTRILSRHSMTDSLAEQYLRTRRRTEQLCEPLCTEDYIPQAVEFASPPKWHLAHVTWFFETMILQKYLPGYEVFHKDFNFLFNSYYQAAGARAIRESGQSRCGPLVHTAPRAASTRWSFPHPGSRSRSGWARRTHFTWATDDAGHTGAILSGSRSHSR